MEKPTALDIILLIVIIFLILLFIWRIFGTSPTLEQIGLILTIFFGLLSLESRYADKQIIKELGNIQKILLEIKDKFK